MNKRDFDFGDSDEIVGGFRPAKKTSFGEFSKRKPFDDGAKKERTEKRKKFVRPQENRDAL